MNIPEIIKLCLSKVIQALASGFGGVSFFVGIFYALMSTDSARYWIAGTCLAVFIMSYAAYKCAILKIYDDR